MNDEKKKYKFWSTYSGLIIINENIRKNKIIISDNQLLIQSICSCVRRGEIPFFNGYPIVDCYDILNNTIKSKLSFN